MNVKAWSSPCGTRIGTSFARRTLEGGYKQRGAEYGRLLEDHL
jgi:hypothetical protein